MDIENERLCWMDVIAKIESYFKLAFIIFFCVAIWYIASIVPLVISKQSALIFSFIFPLGGFGLFVAISLFALFRKTLHIHVYNIRSIVLDEDKPVLDNKVSMIFRKTQKDFVTFLLTFLVWVVFVIVLAASWNGYLRWGVNEIILFDVVGQDWYSNTSGLSFRLASIAIAVLPIFLIIMTGFRLILNFVLGVIALSKLRPIHSPSIVIRKIKPTLNYTILGSLLFSCMAGLFIVFFKEDLLNPLYLLFVIGIVMSGILSVVIPFAIVERKIYFLKKNRTKEIVSALIEKAGVTNMSSEKLGEIIALEKELKDSETTDVALIDWKNFTSFIASVVMPILLAVSEPLMGEEVKKYVDILASEDRLGKIVSLAVVDTQTENFVRSYYKSLSKRDVNSVIDSWYEPKIDKLKNLVNNVDWFELKSVDAEYVDSETGKIRVVTTGKVIGAATPETWKGYVYLIKPKGKWKIKEIDMTRY